MRQVGELEKKSHIYSSRNQTYTYKKKKNKKKKKKHVHAIQVLKTSESKDYNSLQIGCQCFSFQTTLFRLWKQKSRGGVVGKEFLLKNTTALHISKPEDLSFRVVRRGWRWVLEGKKARKWEESDWFFFCLFVCLEWKPLQNGSFCICTEINY